MRVNSVKKALKERKVQIGCGFGQLRSPEVARILAAAGFDWTFLDAEHGGFHIETLQDICRAAVTTGVAPIVRVADMQYALVARALDCGAQGIIFPRVESPEMLGRAVSWTKFPPLGIRGCGIAPTHIEYERARCSFIRAVRPSTSAWSGSNRETRFVSHRASSARSRRAATSAPRLR